MDAVTADLRHYEAQADADQARIDWLERKSVEVAKEWKHELEHGERIILDLGLELGELKQMAQERTQEAQAKSLTLKLRKVVTVDDVILDLASCYCVDNEQELKDAEVCWE